MIPSNWLPVSRADFLKKRGRKTSKGEVRILKTLASMCDLNCLSLDERFYQQENGDICVVLEVKDGKLPVIQEDGFHYKAVCRTMAIKVFDYVTRKMEMTLYRTSLFHFRIAILAAKYLDEKATLKYFDRLKKRKREMRELMRKQLEGDMSEKKPPTEQRYIERYRKAIIDVNSTTEG